jgi:hypothetical protein
VNRYLRTAKVSTPMWDVANATVRRVGNHTAGLATYDRDCLADDSECEESAAAAIRRYGVIVWPPGAHFDYSNLDYGILGGGGGRGFKRRPGRFVTENGVRAARDGRLLSLHRHGHREPGRFPVRPVAAIRAYPTETVDVARGFLGLLQRANWFE